MASKEDVDQRKNRTNLCRCKAKRTILNTEMVKKSKSLIIPSFPNYFAEQKGRKMNKFHKT